MLILTGGACVRTVQVCWLWFELVIPESSDFDASDQMNFDAFYANAKKHRKPYL